MLGADAVSEYIDSFAAVLLHIDSFGKTVILHFQNVHLLAHKNNKIKIICCIYKQNKI